jgi:hypothetical protein
MGRADRRYQLSAKIAVRQLVEGAELCDYRIVDPEYTGRCYRPTR